MDKIILDIQNISKSFYNRTGGHNYLLKNLNLAVKTGEITALIGGNGTGKTTLFNIISGLIAPDDSRKASILYKEKYNLLTYQAHQLAKLGIGRLFQNAHIFPNLSIIENMMIALPDHFGEKPYELLFYPDKNRKTEKQRREKGLTTLEEFFSKDSIFIRQADMLAGELSYGQQRLLSLARLIPGSYDLILLDEPTAGVNPALNDTISAMIKSLKDTGKTVFLIEHNMSFIRKTADTVAFLNDGKIEISGKTGDVLNNTKVQLEYLGL